MTRLIYIAGPYSDNEPAAVDLNIQSARQCGKVVAKKGWFPVIPHANTAGFDLLCPGIAYDFWIAGTLALLEACEAIFLAPGWESSRGAKAEEARARARNGGLFQFDRGAGRVAATICR